MDSDLSPNSAQRRLVIPVIDTMPADLLTPLAVYLKLAATEPNSFLLESVEGGESLARYSFIGTRPEMTFRGSERSVVLAGTDGETESPVSVIEFLRSLLDADVATEAEVPPFIGGAIGYFEFSSAEWFEPTLKVGRQGDRSQDARFMIFTSIVAFDHAKQVIKIISLARVNAGAAAQEINAARGSASARNRSVAEILRAGEFHLPARVETDSTEQVTSNWDRADFEAAVGSIKELIAAGECYQVVLSQRFSKQTSASPVAVYRALRSLNPSPYMFLLNFPDQSVVGGSPEMLVRCRDRKLEYRPIAGTRRRGRTEAEDAALAEEMQSDAKEVAEHMMLVDLGRNDLGRVSEFGSVKVTSLMHVEKYSHVQHLVSAVTGMLRDGADRFDAFAACFPAGTVSGAPKVRAIEIISELEPTARGVYSGAVGHFDFAGNMDTCIAIRTIVLEGGVAHMQAGAGIVADSVPELEYEETINKAQAMIRAIEIAESGAF